MNSILHGITKIFSYELYKGEHINITVGTIIFAIITFLITYFIIKLIKKAVIRIFAINDNGRIETVFNFLSYFIYVIVFFSILSAIGVNISMFLTATAAIFVGLGFALQQIFQDLIAGIYILLDRTLNIGDIIDINGKVAKVNEINLRSTIVETRDRRILVIPNRIFINEIINNWTQDDVVTRAKIEVGVYIGTDVQLVKEVLLKSVENIESVLKSPEPTVILDHFGESSLRFHLRYFINDSYNNDIIASDIRFEIDRLFKEYGIQLPVPVLKVENKIGV